MLTAKPLYPIIAHISIMSGKTRMVGIEVTKEMLEDQVNNLLFNMMEGLKPKDLTQDEVKLLESRYGKDWFHALGYREEDRWENPEESLKLEIEFTEINLREALCKIDPGLYDILVHKIKLRLPEILDYMFIEGFRCVLAQKEIGLSTRDIGLLLKAYNDLHDKDGLGYLKFND